MTKTEGFQTKIRIDVYNSREQNWRCLQDRHRSLCCRYTGRPTN